MKKKAVSKIGFDQAPFNDMVIFDLETTGLSSRFDDIIQIAAMRIINGKIVEEDFFSTYVKPPRPLPYFIVSYTGITENDVRNAPSPDQALSAFSQYCRDSLLVGHNGHTFDIPFIRNACERYRIKTRESLHMDSMHLSWNLWGRAKGISHGLDSVISRLNVSRAGARRHDARGDVLLTAKCVKDMVEQLGTKADGVSVKISECVLPQINGS